MKSTFNPKYVNLDQVLRISRGDEKKRNTYLNQFLSLIPERIEILKAGMNDKDRIAVRKAVHNMGPQIQFFGISEMSSYITRVESEYETMSLAEMEEIVTKTIHILKHALEEVSMLLN